MTTIATAFLKGLSLYTATWFAIVHVFVAWKWETANTDGRYTVERIITEDIPADLIQWKEWQSKNLSEAPLLKEIESLRDAIEYAPTYRGSRVDRADEILEECETKLNQSTFEPMEKFLLEGNHTFLGLRLESLLKQDSLLNLTDAELEKLLHVTIGELGSIAGRQHTANWNTLNDILFPKNPFPEKQKIIWEVLEEELCVLPPLNESDYEEEEEYNVEGEGDEDGASLTEEDEGDEYQLEEFSLYVQEDDLKERYLEVTSMMEERRLKIPSSLQNRSIVVNQFANTTKVLKQALNDAMGILDAAIKEVSDSIAAMEDSGVGNPDCDVANEDDVYLLLEAGLDALAKRKDVRDALMEALQELDPETAEGLILDADLTPDSTLPQLLSPKKVSLLKLLDSPMLGKLASFVDKCLDRIGGYYDPLDHFLDSQAEKYVDAYDEKASSLGKVYMVYLLVQSGRLNIPLPSRIRKFLESNHRGRAFLASLS